MMLEFQKKKKIKNIMYSRFVLVIILIILFFFVKTTWDFYQKKVESQKRKEMVETELLNLENRKENLEKKINSLNSSVGVEQELRERFDLVKEGEQTILIGDDKKSTTSD